MKDAEKLDLGGWVIEGIDNERGGGEVTGDPGMEIGNG